jgi:hypothetical protein
MVQAAQNLARAGSSQVLPEFLEGVPEPLPPIIRLL